MKDRVLAWLKSELVLSLLALVVIAGLYLRAARSGGAPSPGGFVGHGLGVVGFLMMLATETLYSLRKRVRGFHWGRMTHWMRAHVFTGLVGQTLVLLHSAGKFHGLAGVVSLLTVLVVLSGFIGRYLYTAVPRTLDGMELTVVELEGRIAEADRRLRSLGVDLFSEEIVSAANWVPKSGWLLVLGRFWLRWRQHRRLRRAIRALGPALAAKARHIEKLLEERYRVLLSIHSLAAARRLLALWHVFHVPLGVSLFTLACLHVWGALYYSTFLK